MKNMLVKKLIVAAVIIPSVAFSAFSAYGPSAARAQAEPSCDTLTLVSGAATETAGYTETDPGSASAALQASAYSDTSFGSAVATETVIPPWVDPSAEADLSGAVWVSTDDSWPGGSGNDEGSVTSSQWRLFQESFTLPDGATVSSSQLYFAADNAVEVYLNGDTSPIATTDDVYGDVSDTSAQNFASVSGDSFTPVADEENTLSFVVRNWQADADTNPTGLIYKAVIDYCVPGNSEDENVQVHVLKYLDGEMANATSSEDYDFPMTWTYRAANVNENATTTDEFVLGNNEGGAEALYGADSVELEAPAYLTLSEVTTGTSTMVLPNGASCEANKYRLQGYKVSNTSFEDAAASTLQTTAPVFTDLNEDQYVIVYNESCDENSDGELHVDSIEMVDSTATAGGDFEDGWEYVFHVTVPTDEPNVAMKFLDWVSNSDSNDVIPVAGNMRISSEQAVNEGTIVLTAEDTYSTPELVINEDLDSGMAGMQIEIVVEVQIPSGTDNGDYTTTYGIRSTPVVSS